MPLNTLPFPSHEDVPYYDNKDKDGFLTMPVEQYKRNSAGSFVPVGDASPLPIKDADVLAKLVEILSKLSSDPATQTTLADISAKLATVSKQDVIIGHVDGVETALANILAKIIAAPATEAKQDTIIGHVDGVEATLSSILAKIIASPATAAEQAALKALIGEVQAIPTANTLLARLKSLEDKIDAIIIAAPATEAKQDTIIGHVDGVEATLSSILAKIIASPATAAEQAALKALIGEVQAIPTANTLLARLKSLEDKIDAITAGTTPVVSQLSGSNMELYGPTLAARPDISTVPIGATYTIVDDTQNFDSFISNGVKWLEV